MALRGSRTLACLVTLLALANGCGVDSSGTGGSSGPNGGAPSPGSSGGQVGGGSGGGDNGGSGGNGGAGGDAGSASNDAGATLDANAPGSDGGSIGQTPGSPILPTPAGACPDFANGAVKFNPAGGTQRDVTLYMSDAAKTKHGPLIFYFYGTYGSPADAQQGLAGSITAIEAAGGIVAAPTSIATGQFPWLDADPTPDFEMVDEVVGCAIQKVGIDTSHIHAMGFSAGALFATQLAFARSNYLASLATYSGGLLQSGAPTQQNASNKWSAAIFTGGTSDNVFNTDFLKASQALQTTLKGEGHFAMLCNHGGGHSVPPQYTGPVWQFFQDNPFGAPSPYAKGPPSAFSACTL